MKTEKFHITGMTCAACQANITRQVGKLNGVESVEVNLLANDMRVAYREDQITAEAIVSAVTDIGYGASPDRGNAAEPEKNGLTGSREHRKKAAEQEKKQMKIRLSASVALLLPLMYISMGGMLGLPLPQLLSGTENLLIRVFLQFLLTLAVVFLNRKFYIQGTKALLHRAPNMDSLVAIGSGASLVYGIYVLFVMLYAAGRGDMANADANAHSLYLESAAMILTLVTVGKYLEARSKSKTSDALDKLADLAPKTANVLRNGKEQTIPAARVLAGDTVIIRPGDSIPADGIVTEGSGYVDQSAITGESIPVEKNPGDAVISATVNQNGSFFFRARQVGEDTTLARIIRLVDEAGTSKAPIARLADKVSGIFVPVVIAIACITAAAWLIAGQSFSFALTNAVSVLVISCPCALGLATPVAIMVGTGKAAEYGILIKSAQSLETLHGIDTVVLDKTGTVTSGVPSVTDVVLFDKSVTEQEFLSEAAAAESGSNHPLALAVVRKAKAEALPIPSAKAFQSESGRGIRAAVNGKNYIAGNLRYMQENGLLSNPEPQTQALLHDFAAMGKTPLIFAANGKLIGVMAVADTIREDSKKAIEQFKKNKLKVIMLTGDNRLTAQAVQKQLGIDEVIADVLPADKQAHIRRLTESGKKVAMIGDGINDAPALATADVGIAIGSGTDIAIDSADIVLMKNSLQDALTAIELSRSVIKNIKMNLFWAFFYNALGIPLAAGILFPVFGWTLSPMIASAAMSLSSVCVVTNALRLRFFKPKHRTQPNLPTSAELSADPINKKMKGTYTMKKTLKIDGMMCGHCKMHVEKALGGIDGVSEAIADLEAKQAAVTMTKQIPDEVLANAVTEAGYTVLGVE